MHATHSEPLEFATFHVGDSLLGINIHQVQEINRNLDLTHVPHAPPALRGVINLRGDVVSVLDLRVVLGLPATEINRATRNIVVAVGEERIGLLVDRIADVIHATATDIESPPANLQFETGRFFSGVHKLEHDLLLILDIENVVALSQSGAAAA